MYYLAFITNIIIHENMLLSLLLLLLFIYLFIYFVVRFLIISLLFNKPLLLCPQELRLADPAQQSGRGPRLSINAYNEYNK